LIGKLSGHFTVLSVLLSCKEFYHFKAYHVMIFRLFICWI